MQAKKVCKYKCEIWSRPTNGESPSWRFCGTLAARRRNRNWPVIECYRKSCLDGGEMSGVTTCLWRQKRTSTRILTRPSLQKISA
jgi:hypothetical protein